MGNCCSTCVRPKKKKRKKRKSTAWTDSSGESSSSSLPSAEGNNQCKHNVVRPKYLTEPCSPFDFTNLWPSAEPLNERFTRNTGALPIWAEHQKQGIDIQLDRAIWERERYMGESSSQSTSSDEDEEPRMADSGPCYSGGVPRLKKKDSTRQPRYKDEIMLADNIDSIIDQEIPNEDDLRGACAGPSTSSAAQNFTRAKYVVQDDACANGTAGPSACSSAADARPQMNGRWKHNVRIIEEDVEADDAVSVPLSIQSVSVPTNVRSNMQPMDEEDVRVAQEIQEILRRDALKGKQDEEVVPCIPDTTPLPEETNSAGTPSSEFEYTDEEVSKLYSPASSTPSIAGTLSPQVDDELAKDIDYIFNDDIPAEEPDEPDAGAVTSLEESHVSKDIIPTTESNKPVENNLEKNVDDEIAAVDETHKASPSEDFQRPEISSTPEIPKNDSVTSIVDDLSVDEEVATTEIEYILSEEVPAVESGETVDSNSVVATHPETYPANTPQLEDEDGVECIPLPKAIPSRSSAVSNLGKDCVQSAPQREQQNSKTTVNILQFHVQDDSISSNPNARLHLQWAYPTSTCTQKLTDSNMPSPKTSNPKCDLTVTDALPRPEKNFSETTRKLAEEVIAMDVDTVLGDEMPAAKLNWYGAAPRPKTRNPRRDFVVNAEKNANAIPRVRHKYTDLGNQTDNAQDMTPNQTAPQSAGSGARPKTSIIKKPIRREDLEMAKAFNETSEKPESVLSFSILGTSTDPGRKQTAPLRSICRESELMHTKKSVANLIRVKEFKRSTALSPLDRSGRNSESPYGRPSNSSIDSRYCDSSCSVVNGDALRPMAVRSSKVASSAFSSDAVSPSCPVDATMPRPPTSSKGKSRRPIIFVRPAPDTRIPGVGAHRKAAVHTDNSQSGAYAHASSGNVYDSKERNEVEQSYDAKNLHMAVNRRAAVPLGVSRSSHSQSSSFGRIYDTEDQKFVMNVDRPMAGKVSVESRRRFTSAMDDNSPQSMASHEEAAGPVSDTDGHACAGLLYTAEELGLMVHIEGQLD